MASSPLKTDSGSDIPIPYEDDMAADTVPRGWSAWFGGPNTAIGPRIAPRIAPLPDQVAEDSDSGLSSNAILEKQLAQEAGSAIQYRTCSWQKTAALLFSEYICLVRTTYLINYIVTIASSPQSTSVYPATPSPF